MLSSIACMLVMTGQLSQVCMTVCSAVYWTRHKAARLLSLRMLGARVEECKLQTELMAYLSSSSEACQHYLSSSWALPAPLELKLGIAGLTDPERSCMQWKSVGTEGHGTSCMVKKVVPNWMSGSSSNNLCNGICSSLTVPAIPQAWLSK